MKELYTALKDNPSAVLMSILVAGAGLVYNDFRDYISENQTYQRQQYEKQQELNEKFVSSLNEIAGRLNTIEKTIQNQTK